MESMIFALLPLGLFSLWSRLPRSTAGILPLLGALAPVLAKGVGSLIGSKQKQSAAKQQAAYEAQLAQQQEQEAKAAFEAAQNTPAKAMERMKFNMQLGRLLGKAGGRGKLPPSLMKQLDTARAMPTYTPGASYVPKPTGGAGKWDFAAGLADALSYLDTSKLGRPKITGPGQPVGNIVPNISRPVARPVGPLVSAPIKRQPLLPYEEPRQPYGMEG